jgi:hypothetical protein
MAAFRQLMGRWRLRGKDRVVGWSMTPEEAVTFFQKQGKTVLTFYGYSVDYNNMDAMFKVVREVLSHYRPEKTLVNIGATTGGMGKAYPLIKSLKFVTAGIVSTEALAKPEYVSAAVDHICFIQDKQWGGRLPNSSELSPTSKAMVACSDILVAIGGGDIVRDELLAGRAQGKPIQYFPAEMNHETAMRRAKHQGKPLSEVVMGSAHDVFGR